MQCGACQHCWPLADDICQCKNLEEMMGDGHVGDMGHVLEVAPVDRPQVQRSMHGTCGQQLVGRASKSLLEFKRSSAAHQLPCS